MFVFLFVLLTGGTAMAQLTPLQQYNQQQYQERLRESQEFMDRARQEHEWQQQRQRDEDIEDKLDRLHRDLGDD